MTNFNITAQLTIWEVI